MKARLVSLINNLPKVVLKIGVIVFLLGVSALMGFDLKSKSDVLIFAYTDPEMVRALKTGVEARQLGQRKGLMEYLAPSPETTESGKLSFLSPVGAKK